jgi:hypothetical protein
MRFAAGMSLVDFASARELYERSLADFRELKDQLGLAGALADLGNLERDLRDHSVAGARYHESLGIFFQRLNQKRGLARSLEAFASSAALQEKSGPALRLAGAAAALRKSIGVPPTPREQARLGRSLEASRRELGLAAGSAVWPEGWVMPPEEAIEIALGSGKMPRPAGLGESPAAEDGGS